MYPCEEIAQANWHGSARGGQFAEHLDSAESLDEVTIGLSRGVTRGSYFKTSVISKSPGGTLCLPALPCLGMTML